MKTREVKINDYFDEYGVYDMEDVLDNLDTYVGISKEDLMVKLCSVDDIIGLDLICSYCRDNFHIWVQTVRFIENNINDFLKNRISDYEFMVSGYNIYKKKGLDLLDLMQYIVISGKVGNGKYIFDKNKELYLEKLDICHKNSVVTGAVVISILVALRNIIDEIDKIILEINNLDNYQRKKFDWLSIQNRDNVLPSESLVYDESRNDKTSIRIIKRRFG